MTSTSVRGFAVLLTHSSLSLLCILWPLHFVETWSLGPSFEHVQCVSSEVLSNWNTLLQLRGYSSEARARVVEIVVATVKWSLFTFAMKIKRPLWIGLGSKRCHTFAVAWKHMPGAVNFFKANDKRFPLELNSHSTILLDLSAQYEKDMNRGKETASDQ